MKTNWILLGVIGGIAAYFGIAIFSSGGNSGLLPKLEKIK